MARSVALVLWCWLACSAVSLLLIIARGEWIAHRDRRTGEPRR